MLDSKSPVHQNPEAESDDSTRFDNCLQELRDLRCQLHHAADYCDATFLKAIEKKAVVENTKEYICRAVVTVVDHLGSVSAALDYKLSTTNSVSQTEFRIDCLKQKIMTCQQHSHKLALRRLCWSPDFPKYHPRYISPPIPDIQKSNGVLRELGSPIAAKSKNKHEFKTEKEVPLFLYTYSYKPSLVEVSTTDIGSENREKRSAPVLPVRDGLSLLPQPQHPSFHFQETRKPKRNMLNWKSVQNNDFISLIRRSKRTS